MKMLILGGTRFLGHFIAAAAVERGHQVTLFHRGETPPDQSGISKVVHGDRDGGLDNLGSGSWDAVIDTCGYVPRVVRQSVELLANRVSTYVYISSISAYAPGLAPGSDESGATVTLDDPTVEEVSGETYGGLKALCEEVVAGRFPTTGSAAESGSGGLILRPGFIVGPRDYSWRFPYWIHAVQHSPRVIVPGDGSEVLQVIDVRDVGTFVVTAVEESFRGTYNVAGPLEPIRWQAVPSIIAAALSTSTEIVSVSQDRLDAEGVPPETFPLFAPGDAQAFMQVSASAARGVGLKYRPLPETIRDTAEWMPGNTPAERPKAWPSVEVETRLSAADSH